MREAVLRKCRESIDVKAAFFEAEADKILSLSEAMADAFSAGHRLYVMGNGGSACDALHVAVEFVHPIFEKRRALPVIALNTDPAILTAIGNDKDFSKVFTDQLQLMGQAGDMAMVISTSGKSPNLIQALQMAKEKSMLTIGLLGKDGGRIQQVADYAFVVPSFSIHRIQEAHVALYHIVWDMIHIHLGEEDVI